MSGEVEACPLCDETTVVDRESRPPEERYRCFTCGHVFPTPRRRAKKGRTGETSMAALLESMDVEDAGLSPHGERRGQA